MTGARTELPASVGQLVRDVTADSPVPVAVGFGVSQPAHVRAIAEAGAAASSSPRPWSIRWGPTAATWMPWPAWSGAARRDLSDRSRILRP